MRLETIKDAVRPFLPQPLRALLRRVRSLRVRLRESRLYRRGQYFILDRRDRSAAASSGFECLPPARLRHKVSTTPALDRFLSVGSKCSEDVVRALAGSGRALTSFRDVLDFGCGCGRTLIWLARAAPSSRFFGVDVDAEAIDWCSRHLKVAEFSLGRPLPPLDFAPDRFDLIYAISVFTHLNEEYQFCWLEELQRVTRPGGVVLLTLHGPSTHRHVPPDQAAEVREKGFAFVHSYPKHFHPEWYQNTFHSKEYVYENYSRYFEILDYIPQGLAGFQDIVVLRKAA
jgi:SAM-dependent methyltransferase